MDILLTTNMFPSSLPDFTKELDLNYKNDFLNAKEVYQEEKIRSVRTFNNDQPRRFRGYGYSEPPTIEVTPAPMNQEPRFKNKIEEFIHIAKQKSY